MHEMDCCLARQSKLLWTVESVTLDGPDQKARPRAM